MLDAHKVRWETRDLQELLLQRFGMFEMDEQAELLEQTYDDVVRLTLGKSELPVHPAITDAMVAALRDPKRSSLVYPLGLPELRTAIADYEGQARGRSVDPETVVVSVGSSTIFRNLFTLLSYQGGEILIPRPYYSLYLYSAALAGARVGYYDIDPGTGRIDFDSLGAVIGDATRAVVVCSPGNPLGNLCTRADFERLDALVTAGP